MIQPFKHGRPRTGRRKFDDPAAARFNKLASDADYILDDLADAAASDFSARAATDLDGIGRHAEVDAGEQSAHQNMSAVAVDTVLCTLYLDHPFTCWVVCISG